MTGPRTLADIEAEHGFTFGHDGSSGPGQPIAAVACSTPTCPRRGQHHQVHDDTVQPVHCGGCGAVLHCDHVEEMTRIRDGNLAAPVEHTVVTCRRCGTETGRTTRDLDPAEVLRSLPLSALDQLLGGV